MNEMQSRSSFQKRAAIEVTEFGILFLPTWILLEIFLRLPLKTVIRCRSVCRYWYKILSRQDFINNYSKNPHFSTFLLPMYDHDRMHLCLFEISRSGVLIHTLIKPKSVGFSRVACESSIIGSCNGLLCTCLANSSRAQIYISNPITGDCIALPTCVVKTSSPILGSKSFNMFGAIPNTNIFKVVRITMEGITLKGQIFTVGVDKKWRNLPNPLTPTSFWYGGNGTVLNGIAHWTFEEIDGLFYSISILTFDIEKEIFGRISHPPNMVLKLKNSMFVLNDKLCLIDYEVPPKIAVWTMQEYGVVNSWSKVFASYAWLSSSVFSCSLVTVAFLPYGHVIVSHGVDEYAIIYPSKLPIFLESEDLDRRRSFISHILTYTPMFIPMENAIAGEIVKL